MKIAYMMSRFPKLTETFVLYEIVEMEKRGMAVSIYPLLRESHTVSHPDADQLVSRAHYAPFLSSAIVGANLRVFRQEPRKYVGTLWEALRGTFGSLKFFGGAVAFFPKAVMFAAQMQAERVQHLHAHFATHPALAALIVHRLTGIPFSFTVHGTDLHRDQRMLAEKISAADFAVTVSDFNRRFIGERCGDHFDNKVEVIHCGVDTEYFHPRTESRRPGPFRIVCVASFEEVKGHRYLVEACAQLRALGKEFECFLIGSGPLQKQVEEQIKAAHLEGHVHILGPRSRSDVRQMLWDADAAVLASVPTSSGQREGIPVALMEAMACGLPVVSSNMSGIPELVESGVSGVLVPPGDARAIAQVLKRLISDKNCASELGTAARRKILEEFDLRTNAAKLAASFEAHTTTPRHTECAVA